MLVSTPAIVLHAFPYGETSKIVRLATRDHGVQSAIAKGARRPKSRFGARLELLSQGVAQYYFKPTRDLQTLSAFDVTAQRRALAGDVRRYATASAVAELVLRTAPPDPNPELFDLFAAELDALAEVSLQDLAVRGIAALWRVVGGLGFGPSLDICARDGAELSPNGSAKFAVDDGGFLCASCARGRKTSDLSSEHRATLVALVHGDTAPVVAMTPRAAQAHRRLLRRFIVRHVSEDKALKALTFWETMPWTATS
jgi:DNA repair protein RecO (recombination protein O)